MEANYFTILYWFCHTSTWIRHGCTCIPHPEPPFHLPPCIIPLGHPSAPAPSILFPASNLDVPLVYFYSCFLWFWCHIQQIIIKTSIMKLSLMISSQRFIVTGFTSKPIIHLVLNFCLCCKISVQVLDFPGGPVVKNPPGMQRTWVESLIWEYFTCPGATKPMKHDYWSPHALEPMFRNYWAHMP